MTLHVCIVTMTHCQHRPYESTRLDRLQVLAYATQFLFLFFGMLFATFKGANELQSTLEWIFLGLAGLTAIGFVWMAVEDIRRYNRGQLIAGLDQEHKLGINPKEWINMPLYTWAVKDPPLDELMQLKDFLASRKKYPCPAHLKEPILFLAKGSPVLMEWVCYESQHWLQSTGPLGCSPKYFISTANANLSLEGQPGRVIKEEIDESAASALSWICRDIKEQREITTTSDFEDTDEPTCAFHSCQRTIPCLFCCRYICDLFKECFTGEILWYMINCTEEERQSAVDLFKNITGDFTGIPAQHRKGRD